MQLTAFNFIISYRLRKINLINASLRHSDYKDVIQVSETMKQLLLTLQRKLVTLRSVLSSQYVKQVLLRVHWTDEIRDFKSENELSESLDKALIQQNCDVTELQLNSVAETVDCKQLISCVMMRALAIHETVWERLSQPL